MGWAQLGWRVWVRLKGSARGLRACANNLDPACSTGQVEKGATAAVFGLGTIGLACVDALKTVGASRIIAVDTDPGKHARAKEWGATDVLNPKDFDKPIQVRSPYTLGGT